MTCKKILLCEQTKLIENFPRLCLNYALAVEGQKPFAIIQVVRAECFDLAGMIDRIKRNLEGLPDNVNRMLSDDLYFCLSCGFDSIIDFVKQYENAPSCPYYLHTIELQKVDANAKL